MRLFFLTIFLTGCAGAGLSIVVKPPLQSRCQEMPIKECGELVDGVLLYAQGDKAGALAKINRAKDANGPEQLAPFATALRDAASLPGVEEFAAPMHEVADLLNSAHGARFAKDATTRPSEDLAGVASAANAVTTRADMEKPNAEEQKSSANAGEPPILKQDPATRALSAAADLNRLVTKTVNIATESRTPCKVGGTNALCFKVEKGPIIVTDVIGASACPDRVFVGATVSDTPGFGFRWLFESGAAPLTGARLKVGGGDWLQLAVVPSDQGSKRGPLSSQDCMVTWSGFRPWIVPGTLGVH